MLRSLKIKTHTLSNKITRNKIAYNFVINKREYNLQGDVLRELQLFLQ